MDWPRAQALPRRKVGLYLPLLRQHLPDGEGRGVRIIKDQILPRARWQHLGEEGVAEEEPPGWVQLTSPAANCLGDALNEIAQLYKLPILCISTPLVEEAAGTSTLMRLRMIACALVFVIGDSWWSMFQTRNLPDQPSLVSVVMI